MKKEVKKIRTLKLLEKRLTARNKKVIDKIFNEFKEKIVIDNASKNDLKIIIDIDYE